MSDCKASIDGWCETHSNGAGPAWCVDSLRDALRRARFHERELYHRAKEAEATVMRVRVLAEQYDSPDFICGPDYAADLRAALDPEEVDE